MSEKVSEDFKAHTKIIREKRKQTAPAAIKVLQDSGLRYEVKNDGLHYIIEGRVDWWPTSGRWIARKTNRMRFGIASAIKWLRDNPDSKWGA